VPEYCHIALTLVVTVYVVSSVELKLIISHAWQERRWLNLYPQIILRHRTLIFHSLSWKSITMYCLSLHL